MSLRPFLPNTQICAKCAARGECADWCEDCPQRNSDIPTRADHPVWPFTFSDLLLWPGITAAAAWFVIVNPWVGGLTALLATLALIRTLTGIIRSGWHGVRPALWQKLAALADSVWDAIVLAFFALIFLVASVFMMALADRWFDMPDFAHLSAFFGVILGCVVAPALILFMYVQGLPLPASVPGPTPTIVRWLGGLLSMLFVNGTIAAAVVFTVGKWPTWGFVAAGVLLPIVSWSVWAALLELGTRFDVTPWRMVRLVLRGSGVLLEAVLLGSTLAAAGCMLPVLARATNAAGIWQELANWGGVGLGVGMGSLLTMVWWWRSRPRLLPALTLETQAARDALVIAAAPEVPLPADNSTFAYDELHLVRRRKKHRRHREDRSRDKSSSPAVPPPGEIAAHDSQSSDQPAKHPQEITPGRTSAG